MTASKERLTVTVDPDLVKAGNDAVRRGRAASLSAWVNGALSERAAKDRRLAAMALAVATYEREHREISAEELDAQARSDRRAAIVLRGGARAPGAVRKRSGAR